MSSDSMPVLIIDDEADIRELLEITLSRMGLETVTAGTYREAVAIIERRPLGLCLTDMNLPDGNGLSIIEFIQKHSPSTPVAVITAYGSLELAIDSLKAGAFDFISKPLDLEKLRELVQSALRLQARSGDSGTEANSRLLGVSPQIQALKQQVNKLARSQAPVHISGESGTGKEVVARLIHANGPRSDAPFIPVNCGAIPAELVESELFGHVKGSFTGAYENKRGLFEAAEGGTLFLDEIADLPMSMQVKLLRAIQEKSIRPVGASQELAVDVRILSATHKVLADEVKQERFRTDLFYRINVIELKLNSLRERPEDIPVLAQHFVERLAREWQIEKPEIAPPALKALCSYSFPGNVRELENIIERAMALYDGKTITNADLQLPAQAASAGSAAGKSNVEDAFGRLDEYLQDIESEVVQEALQRCRWNKTEAAKLLGISFRQLRYRLDKLALPDQESPP